MESQKSMKTYYGFLLVKKVGGTICGRFPVTKKECTLGRDNSCDIRILLEKVSAQQCIILCVDDKAYVRDKSVAGSTKVNGKKIGRSNFLLHDSDEIEICGRKFVWEYPKKPHGELNNLSYRKSGTKTDHLSPRATERFSIQAITPLDSNKIFSTPSKSSIKTPSKTIISLNKTPIVITTENMSKSSFDEVQNNFQNPNSIITAQSESKLMKSYSMTPVRNIPLLGDSKTTQRKSWIVTNTSDNSSSIGAHNRLSTERLKRDSTPELNSSYHYEDENVEFDSPDPPELVLNSKHSIDINTNEISDNSFPLDNQSELHDKDNNILQSTKDEINKLSVFEPGQGTSRRDTYSVDNRPIVFEENTTPAPRRSILKCSKTTKPNRSRSSCRMVQFARLPKTDSKIKNIKTRINPSFNFIVTDDENNANDFNQSTNNSMHFNVEEYDDDLDGVQPLDNSVSSLVNSPILDNSINKSSKRGSRGNKVMSLVNSIEKRTNESSKHSIRASDLLSMNGSKHIETSPTDGSENNANILHESVSSTRRINLEDIFEAEDSLKTTCHVENESLVKEINESSVKSAETVSSPKTNLFEIKDLEKIPDNVKDISENDTNNLEYEYTFASPLKLPTMYSSSIKIIDSDSTFVDIKKNFNSTAIIDNLSDTNSKIDMATTSTNEFSTKSDNVERLALDHELSTLPHDGNIDETQKDNSNHFEKTVDEEMCTDNVETSNDITKLSEKPIGKERNQEQKENFEFVNDNTNASQILKNDAEFANKIKPIEEELNNSRQNDIVKLVNKSTDLNFDKIDKQNYISKVVEQTLNGETPSIVVQSISEMFNVSIDEHETTNSKHKENLVETYILIEKDDLQNSLEVNELKKVNLDKCNKTLSENSVLSAKPVNKSLMEAIEVQLDKMHNECNESSNCNENNIAIVDSILDLNKQKTTSNLVFEGTNTENLTLKINYNLSNNSLNTLTVAESTEIMSNSLSKTKPLAKDNISNNCLTDVDSSNISKLPIRTVVDEMSAMQNINVNDEDSNRLSKTMPSINLSVKDISLKPIKKHKINLDQLRTALGANNSKDLRKSVQSPINASVGHEHSKIDSTKRIAELCLSSDDDDENNKTIKNLDHSLDTSIGKPRYESTPWNCSKSLKTPFNSTASIQPNETTRDNSAENEDRPRDKSRSRSVTPFASQKEWSQMMKEFNESVKKASVNININNTSIRKKKLFVKKSKLSQVSTRIPAKESLFSKDSNIKNNTSEINKNISTRRSSSISKNTLNKSAQVKRSMRNESVQVRTSKKPNKLQTSYIDNYDSAETSNSDELLPEKNKSVDKKTNNKTVKKNTNHPRKSKTITISKTDSEVETVSNEIPTFERELRMRKQNNYTSSIKTKKNTLNTNNVKTTEKSKKNTSSIKRSIVDTKIALSESGVLKLNKKNRTSHVIKPKSTKISKTIKTKKSTNLRTNKNSRSKRLLPSKPLKTNAKDSSEYESSSENEESTQKLKLVNYPLKLIKEKTQKKDVYIDNNLFSLPTRRSQREKLKMSDVSMHRRTQSHKHAANTSSLIQNSKDKKKNILSEVVVSPVSQASNSLKKPNYTLPRLNSAINLISDNSLPETTKKSVSLRSKKNSQPNHVLPSKPIKTNTKDSLRYEFSTETKEKTKTKNVNVDNNLSSLSTKRNLREKSKTSSVISQPSKTQSRKRAADTSPLSQPNTKGKKCDISSKVANTVSRASYSPKIRTRNMSKLSVKQVSDNSVSETTIVSKKGKKKSTEKVKPKSNENIRAKKRQLNSDDCSFDSAPSTSKKIRQVTLRGAESINKKSDSSTCTTSKIKIQNTDTSTEPTSSLKVKYNKNAEKSILPIQRKTRNAEKSISPIQRKTRKAKQTTSKDKETLISPRVLRVRDKKK